MELIERIKIVLDQHGIDQDREIIIRSSTGSLYHVPISRLLDVISNLYQKQQSIISVKLDEVESCANLLMDFMYYLAKPLAKIKI
ncbi:MAG: hypothetical protein ACI9J3_003007 [Parvicellaceae bacterium]|jgi:hypothetical protein